MAGTYGWDAVQKDPRLKQHNDNVAQQQIDMPHLPLPFPLLLILLLSFQNNNANANKNGALALPCNSFAQAVFCMITFPNCLSVHERLELALLRLLPLTTTTVVAVMSRHSCIMMVVQIQSF